MSCHAVECAAEQVQMQAQFVAATKTVSSSAIVASNSLQIPGQSIHIQREGTVTPYTEEGAVVVEPDIKPKSQSSDHSIQAAKKKSKFEERVPLANLSPNGHQVCHRLYF